MVAGEVDVFPAERGQMDEELIGNLIDLMEGGNSTYKVTGVPEMIAVTRQGGSKPAAIRSVIPTTGCRTWRSYTTQRSICSHAPNQPPV